jgi:hypothetical protein
MVGRWWRRNLCSLFRIPILGSIESRKARENREEGMGRKRIINRVRIVGVMQS